MVFSESVGQFLCCSFGILVVMDVYSFVKTIVQNLKSFQNDASFRLLHRHQEQAQAFEGGSWRKVELDYDTKKFLFRLPGHQKKIRRPKPWKHTEDITRAQLKQMRDEFWDTAPHYGGKKGTRLWR